MAKKEVKKSDNNKTKDNMYYVLNLVLAIVTMVLAGLLAGYATADPMDSKKVAFALGITILSQVSFQVLLFLVKDTKKDRLRASLVGIIYIIAMIVAFLSTNSYLLLYLSTFFVLGAMILNQILLIDFKNDKKASLTNILVAVMLTLLLIALIVTMKEEDAHYSPLVVVLLFLFLAFKKLIFPSLKLERIKLLLKILIETHTIDVIICLVSFMIVFSFILPRFESINGNITTFWDALWYCFTVVTTIGFGDFYATSLVGRTLTVILGIYGIVVVAIITSVVVNFYNEVSSKSKARDFIE